MKNVISAGISVLVAYMLFFEQVVKLAVRVAGEFRQQFKEVVR